MPGVLVCIAPPEKIQRNILELKEIIRNRFGRIPLFDAEPHINLFCNSYDNLQQVENSLLEVLRNHKPFGAMFEGLHVFTLDPLTNKQTIVYKIKNNDNLKKLQIDIVEKLNPLRNKFQERWVLKQNPNASGKIKENISKYGYPFGPDDWIFHATVYGIPHDKIEIFWKEIKKFDKSVSWKIDSIELYVLDDNGSEWKFYKRIKL